MGISMSNLQINFFAPSIMRFSLMNVFLPNDVIPMMKENNKNYERKMKTLILLNGFSGNCMDWGYGSLANELAAKYNIAVVMPTGDNSFYLNAKGSCFAYEDYIANDVVNYLRMTFNLALSPEDTFIGGLSMGGFGAIHTGLKHPETFGKIFGLSSALIVNNIKDLKEGTRDFIADYDYYVHTFGDLSKIKETDVDPEYVVKKRLEKGEKIQPVYMACGSEDPIVQTNREFRDFLNERNVPLKYIESTGVHDWKFWNEYLEPAMAWLVEE